MKIRCYMVIITSFLCLCIKSNPQSEDKQHSLEPPSVSSFSAFPSVIKKGDTAILSVFISNADIARIEPEIGEIDIKEHNFIVTPQQTTTYILWVTNSAGSVKKEVTIVVDGPSILVQPENTSVTEGEDAEFTVVASENSIKYQWLKNGVPISGATASKLVLEKVTLTDNNSKFEVLVITPTDSVISETAILRVAPIRAPVKYYVSSTGNDNSGNGTEISPWKTIQKAADTVLAGDTVLVLPGIYEERIKIKRGGANNQPIVFCSAAQHQAKVKHGFSIEANYIIIEGFDITHDKGGWQENGIWIAGDNISIIDTYIHDIPGGGISPSWGGKGSWNHITLSKNHIYNCNSGLVASGYDWLVENNEIERLHNTGAGDSDYSRLFGRKIVFRGNYFHGTLKEEIGSSHVDGWQFFSNNGEFLDDVLIERNWVEDFHQGAMLSGAGLGKITFRNNIIVSKKWGGAWGICAEDVPNSHIIVINNTFKVLYHGVGVRNSFESGKLEIWNNIIYNSGSSYWSENVPIVGSHNLIYLSPDRKMGTNCLPEDICDMDPAFINVKEDEEENWNFTPQKNSPAKDNGFNLSEQFGFNNDFNGNPRPSDNTWDIGAIEIND